MTNTHTPAIQAMSAIHIRERLTLKGTAAMLGSLAPALDADQGSVTLYDVRRMYARFMDRDPSNLLHECSHNEMAFAGTETYCENCGAIL